MPGILDAIANLKTDRLVVTRRVGGSFVTGRWTPGEPPTFTADAVTDVITSADHGFELGRMVQFVSDGVLPGGLEADTVYWVIPVDDDTFQVALSMADAVSAIAVDITDAGTGEHSLRFVVDAVVQPARGVQRVTGGKDMREDQTNQSTTDVNVVWTTVALLPRQEGIEPDEVRYQDRDWTVFRVEDTWNLRGKVHYKFIITARTHGSL